MPQITNGEVTYEHPNKVGDYVIPKAIVKLSFVLAPDEPAEQAITNVGNMAHGIAVAMATRSVAAAVGGELQQVIPPTPVPATRGRTRTAAATPATPPASAEPETTGETGSTSGAGSTATPAASPSNPPAGETADPFLTPTAGATVAPATPAAPVPGVSTPASPAAEPANPKLSDNGLRQACQHKVESAGVDVASRQVMHAHVRALVTLFTGKPELPIQSVGDVEKRTEFLRRLEANEWAKDGEVLA